MAVEALKYRVWCSVRTASPRARTWESLAARMDPHAAPGRQCAATSKKYQYLLPGISATTHLLIDVV
jgi:hypothetical protein